MGFNDAIRELIDALTDGRFQAVARGPRNQLENGLKTPAEVVAMLRKCDQADYEVSTHHDDPTVDVHVFMPRFRRVRWYIKAYFVEYDEQIAVVISVHPSDYQ